LELVADRVDDVRQHAHAREQNHTPWTIGEDSHGRFPAAIAGRQPREHGQAKAVQKLYAAVHWI
jgi:hypothetical protein